MLTVYYYKGENYDTSVKQESLPFICLDAGVTQPRESGEEINLCDK